MKNLRASQALPSNLLDCVTSVASGKKQTWKRNFLPSLPAGLEKCLSYGSFKEIVSNFNKMPRKRSTFGCFGSRAGHHPEIRYGLDAGQGMHVLREFSLPMPEESELNAKFAELVVSEYINRFL